MKKITITHEDGTTDIFELDEVTREDLRMGVAAMDGYCTEGSDWRMLDGIENALAAECYTPEPKSEKDRFVDYVMGFYGYEGIYKDDFKGGHFFRIEIVRAYDVIRDNPLHDWDGGTTHDREAACAYIERMREEGYGTHEWAYGKQPVMNSLRQE